MSKIQYNLSAYKNVIRFSILNTTLKIKINNLKVLVPTSFAPFCECTDSWENVIYSIVHCAGSTRRSIENCENYRDRIRKLNVIDKLDWFKILWFWTNDLATMSFPRGLTTKMPLNWLQHFCLSMIGEFLIYKHCCLPIESTTCFRSLFILCRHESLCVWRICKTQRALVRMRKRGFVFLHHGTIGATSRIFTLLGDYINSSMILFETFIAFNILECQIASRRSPVFCESPSDKSKYKSSLLGKKCLANEITYEKE